MRPLVALGVALAAAVSAAAAEPWADPRLPVADGILLWLDAGRQNEARRAAGLPALESGGPVDIWFDGSGGGRHLTQRRREARPRYRRAAGSRRSAAKMAAVRFDGADDSLAAEGPAVELDGFTAFLVAAPRSNAGGFRALLAAAERGRNDYHTGFTLDQGPGGTSELEALNLEGAGFGGAVDLLDRKLPFGPFRLLTAVCDGAGAGLAVDGVTAGRRDRDATPIRADVVTLGARLYSNEPEPPWVQGFLDGDIAEVLLYARALGVAERAAVEGYLRVKNARLLGLRSSDELDRALADASLAPLETVRPGGPDGPPVELLAPGFTTRELPVRLTNVNNVRYREDGVLVALRYNGRIELLDDGDGDGLEERTRTFWEGKDLRAPIGMALTPSAAHGRGVVVAAKGKVVLINDADGDDRAETERVVASGWTELPHGVDALGAAIGADGSIYFGLGCADYTNPYLVDGRTGESGYRVESERGTVLRIAPDLARREIVCTGVRFTAALAFNRHGDLFATDQEGATWLPGGNPRDELLHVVRGRHYGFPPRHERHLPDVIDEPAVEEYGPQHQSACGLVFNEAAPGRAAFGPPHWEGDAIVTGYSRGKVWRTTLHRTAAGYVARSGVLACAGMLPVDAAVSPAGGLVIACHSGAPDWGSGPDGAGKLFKVVYSGRDTPQPVAVWPASPVETRIAFDRPLPADFLDGLEAEVVWGEHVRAGDRFEVLRPGYRVVLEEQAAPRRRLAVDGLRLSADRRTVILDVHAHPARVRYAVRLSGPRVGAGGRPGAIELDYGLEGVEARWEPGAGVSAEPWAGWVPHLDLGAALRFLAGSSAAERVAGLLREPGALVLRARLDLPAGPGALRLAAEAPFRAALGDGKPGGRAVRAATLEVGSDGRPVALTVALETGADPRLEVEWTAGSGGRSGEAASAGGGGRRRPLEAGRLLLPWAPERTAGAEAAGAPPVVAGQPGGHWLRGRDVFFSDDARCSSCHSIRGRGRGVGPDLSNLVHRDPESVLRDIAFPSLAINPDFAAYLVRTRSGDAIVGVPRSEGDAIRVFDSMGNETVVRTRDVVEFRPSAASIMPEDLDDAIGPERLADLIAFLLEPAPSMPADREGPPPPRNSREVEAALAGSREVPSPRPLTVVLVAGPKDHGPGEHDYPAWQAAWGRLLALADAVTVRSAWEWPSAADLDTADVLVFYRRGDWSAERARDLDRFLARGGGLVLIHYAVDGGADPDGLAARIGLAWHGGRSRFRHGPIELRFDAAAPHPVARNLRSLRLHDESYWRLAGDAGAVEVVATGIEEGEAQPLAWTREVGGGRVFVSIPGHYSWTFDDPLFRLLVLRGMAWAVGDPVDRFNALVTAGARVSE